MPVVVKRDGRRENYNQDKIMGGIMKACQKRPIAQVQIERIVENVEKQIMELNESEVSSKEIGSIVINYLKILDQVAYIRFASVYKSFKDIAEFVNDLKLVDEDLSSGKEAGQ